MSHPCARGCIRVRTLTPLTHRSRQLWRIIWDRASNASDWRSESITFYENSKQYHRVTGDQIGNSNVWASLAQRPLFFILNVAVGGDWVGRSSLLKVS